MPHVAQQPEHAVAAHQAAADPRAQQAVDARRPCDTGEILRHKGGRRAVQAQLDDGLHHDTHDAVQCPQGLHPDHEARGDAGLRAAAADEVGRAVVSARTALGHPHRPMRHARRHTAQDQNPLLPAHHAVGHPVSRGGGAALAHPAAHLRRSHEPDAAGERARRRAPLRHERRLHDAQALRRVRRQCPGVLHLPGSEEPHD